MTTATTITAYHGTTARFDRFEASCARGIYGTKSAAYQYGGEHVKALTEIAGVWFSENPQIADGYAEGPEGRILDVEITADRIAEIDWTDEESVADAMAEAPQVLILLDRNEILVLDVATITITCCTKSCGCEMDGDCGCWE